MALKKDPPDKKSKVEEKDESGYSSDEAGLDGLPTTDAPPPPKQKDSEQK